LSESIAKNTSSGKDSARIGRLARSKYEYGVTWDLITVGTFLTMGEAKRDLVTLVGRLMAQGHIAGGSGLQYIRSAGRQQGHQRGAASGGPVPGLIQK
jgi:hypothetical protein